MMGFAEPLNKCVTKNICTDKRETTRPSATVLRIAIETPS